MQETVNVFRCLRLIDSICKHPGTSYWIRVWLTRLFSSISRRTIRMEKRDQSPSTILGNSLILGEVTTDPSARSPRGRCFGTFMVQPRSRSVLMQGFSFLEAYSFQMGTLICFGPVRMGERLSRGMFITTTMAPSSITTNLIHLVRFPCRAAFQPQTAQLLLPLQLL